MVFFIDFLFELTGFDYGFWNAFYLEFVFKIWGKKEKVRKMSDGEEMA